MEYNDIFLQSLTIQRNNTFALMLLKSAIEYQSSSTYLDS